VGTDVLQFALFVRDLFYSILFYIIYIYIYREREREKKRKKERNPLQRG
jgi:preprotein translocase subunit YajC